MMPFAYLVVASLAAGCQNDRIAGAPDPNLAASAGALGRDTDRLPLVSADAPRIMTYNVFLGTNLGPILGAGSEREFLRATTQAYGELQAWDFPARAGKIADQIAAVRPDLVGLQEVALWSVFSRYRPGSRPGAFEVRYDFLQIIIDSLAARGLHYVAASADTTSDVAAPVVTAFDPEGDPIAFDLVRFQDRDAILVKAGVRFSDPQHGKFAAYIPLQVLGRKNGQYRGWCSVLATVDGVTLRFVNTHLEAESPDVNLAQANELVGLLEGVTDPVIWAGDFNSDANTGAPSFSLATAAGFTDLWPAAHPGDPGLTNGPENGVFRPSLVFDARIDLILLRDRFGPAHNVNAAIFGNRTGDEVAPGLWPSDHAAVAVVFDLPRYSAARR